MSSFYVDLTSNTDADNTVANFKNKIQLLNPLQGEWEVALVEISYTKSWKNLRNSYKLWINRPQSGAYDFSPKLDIYYIPELMKRKGVIRAGYYDNIYALIGEINTEMGAKLDDPPKLTIDHITKIVYLKVTTDFKGDMVPNFPVELCEILGLNPQFHDIYNYIVADNHKLIIGERPADLDAWLHTLFVYCDIVEPQYVGNTRAKLLRAVEVPNNTKCGDQIVIKYDNPHYVPLLVNDFEDIEIDIKDDTGETIPFMFGRTRLKLHFRKNV